MTHKWCKPQISKFPTLLSIFGVAANDMIFWKPSNLALKEIRVRLMMIQIHGVGCKFLKSQHLPTLASTKPLRSYVFAIQRLGFASSQLAGSSSDLMVPLKNIIPKVLGSPRCSTLLNRLKTPLDHSVLANSLFGPEVFRWFLGFMISFPCEYFLVTCAVTWGPHYPC